MWVLCDIFYISFASCIGILWSGDSNCSALSPSPRTLVYTTRELAISPWSSRSASSLVLYQISRIQIRNNQPGSETRSVLFNIIGTVNNIYSLCIFYTVPRNSQYLSFLHCVCHCQHMYIHTKLYMVECEILCQHHFLYTLYPIHEYICLIDFLYQRKSLYMINLLVYLMSCILSRSVSTVFV